MFVKQTISTPRHTRHSAFDIQHTAQTHASPMAALRTDLIHWR